ncbi:MAG: DUF58 domain-containing protein [Chloroflexi bacterium]|nr:DUF58 domain-containing protein [Chloroflexota bacterium]
MPVRRRAWLTREGWYYLAVVAFVVGGAVLRSINLLVVLAGLLIAPLIFNWRLVLASLLGLRAERRLPAEAVAGQPLTVELRVENSRGWLSSWLLVVEDRIERVPQAAVGISTEGAGAGPAEPGRTGDVLPGRGALASWAAWQFARAMAKVAGGLRRLAGPAAEDRLRVRTLVRHVPAQGSASAVYRVWLPRRGRYRLGPLCLSTGFPLGLVRGQMVLPQTDELLVLPQRGRMQPGWARLIAAEPAGQQWRQPQRGISEGDYYGLRLWQSGDALRWIHWRTTAKLARPIVRQYERHANVEAVLVLDRYLPPQPQLEDQARLELAISFTATALADLAARGQTRLCLVVAGTPPEVLRVASSAVGCYELLAQLAVLSGADAPLEPALALAAEVRPPRGRLLVVSPRCAADPLLASQMAKLPLDPTDVVWIDTGSPALDELFLLDGAAA